MRPGSDEAGFRQLAEEGAGGTAIDQRAEWRVNRRVSGAFVQDGTADH